MRDAGKISALVAAKLFVIFALLSLLITSRQMPPTGDEPHYLLAAHSLAIDHDLSLKDNYLNRDYRLFYPATLAKRTTFSPDKSRELPAFGPGLSLFLAPFYWLAFSFFPSSLVPFLRLTICATAALGIWQVMLLYLRFAGTRSLSGLSALALAPAFALASPLVTYSSMFYPEVVAFLLIVLGVRRLDEVAERPWRSGAWLVWLAPALIWLHPKYLALSFLLMLLTAFAFYRISNLSRPRFWWIIPALQLAGIAGFFLFLHAEYGSWSPNRIYGGAQKEASLLDLLTREGVARVWVMARMLFGYWIDQRFGVLVYAPAYVAFFPALIWCARRYGMRMLPAILLFAAHFGLISWGAQMGGYAPPSRHFVVLIPLMLLPMLLLFSQWGRAQRWLFWSLAGLGFIMSTLIFTHYRLIFTNATWRNPDGYSEFWSAFGLQEWIPRLTSAPPDYIACVFWTLAAILIAWLLYPRGRGAGEAVQ